MGAPGLKGSIVWLDVPGPSLEGNPLGDPSTRSTPVYLPPGYRTSQRYPAIYFLHGYGGSGGQWLNESAFTPNVPQRLDALIAAGAPPAVGVFVDGWTALGGSQWLNSPAIGRYGDHVARDVPAFIERTLSVRPEAQARALVGKSSGGYGAFWLGQAYPGVFGHLVAHSADCGFEACYLKDVLSLAGVALRPGGVEAWLAEFRERAQATKLRGDDFGIINALCMTAAYSPEAGQPLGVRLPVDPHTGRRLDEVWQRWVELDPVHFVPRRLEAYRGLTSLFFDCGTRDEFNLRWGARTLADALRQGQVPHVHEEFEDGHMQVNYRFSRSLAWLLPRLAAG